MRGGGLFGIGLLLACSFSAGADTQVSKMAQVDVGSDANDVLRKWIESDLHFFPDERGVPKLVLRRQAVKVGIMADPFPFMDEVSRLIGRLSDAVGVTFEMSKRDVNLAIVVDSPVNDGDKPDPGLWRRVGLSQSMYEIVAAEARWASGCGTYTFSNRRGGEVPLSIVFADRKLEAAQIRNCVIEGVIRAFGLRAHRTRVLRAEDGYLQCIALAKALSSCEKKIGMERLSSLSESDQKSTYAGCAAEFLDKP